MLNKEGLKNYSKSHINTLIDFYKFCSEYARLLDLTESYGSIKANFPVKKVQ